MRRRQFSTRKPAFTIVEACVAVASITVLVSTMTTAIGVRRGGADAQAKLATLAQAHACYAADWNERQWSALPYDVGQVSTPC